MIKIIGAGLAGCEAAYFLASRGHKVLLCDIKPKSFTPAHKSENFAELVCSNSLKGADPYSNACGLLKEEMRRIGSLIMRAADSCAVPAGGALAVDREKFSAYVTREIRQNENITCVCEEQATFPSSPCIIATGPLTSDALSEAIEKRLGSPLHFYDASAPIVLGESVDMSQAFFGGRYGKGCEDYINCPMNKEQYENFVAALLSAEKAVLHDFEKSEIFEGCMPIEVMAQRGADTLRFGPFKPVGLRGENGEKFYAVLQLRREDCAGKAYNLVGCQTNLKFPEQKRVFSMIPALADAEFARYGVMHRNTYLNSPDCLNADFSLKGEPLTFFAGQMTGVEGYVESAASGLLCGVHMARKLAKKEAVIPPKTTISGALSAYIAGANGNFQPMNANFGILPPAEKPIRDKKDRYFHLASRALADIEKFAKEVCN